MSKRMYLSDKYCPTCGTRLKLSRMSFSHFCDECREYIKEEDIKTKEVFSWFRVRCD